MKTIKTFDYWLLISLLLGLAILCFILYVYIALSQGCGHVCGDHWAGSHYSGAFIFASTARQINRHSTITPAYKVWRKTDKILTILCIIFVTVVALLCSGCATPGSMKSNKACMLYAVGDGKTWSPVFIYKGDTLSEDFINNAEMRKLFGSPICNCDQKTKHYVN